MDDWRIKVKESLEQFRYTVLMHVNSYSFIKKHKIWKGFWEYGWVGRIMVGLAIIAGLKFLSVFFIWLNDAQDQNPLMAMATMPNMLVDAVQAEYEFFFASGMKYVMVVILEIVIFHASRATVRIKTGIEEDPSFNNFVKAQIRMIKVSLRSYIMEIITVALLGVVFGWFSFIGFLEPVLVFGVQCFYLGFAVLDNYHEQFDIKINDSVKLSRKYIGVAIAAGLILQIFFAIPFAGPLLGPFISAVAVSLVLIEISDLHLRKEVAVVDANELV